jgi:hypothetical protein
MTKQMSLTLHPFIYFHISIIVCNRFFMRTISIFVCVDGVHNTPISSLLISVGNIYIEEEKEVYNTEKCNKCNTIR